MTVTLSIIIITGLLFLLIILNLAAKSKFANKLTGFFLIFSALTGFIIYGYGYAVTVENPMLALVRSVYAVCGMFAGKNELSSISSLEIFDNSYVLILFWIAHFMAFYVTASAAITVVGGEALKKVRLALLRKGELVLIYGTNENALQFGKEYASIKGTSVVFIDNMVSADAAQTIQKMGVAVRSDDKAIEAKEALYKSLYVKPGERKVTICCFKDDEIDNTSFALKTMETFKKMKINPKQTTLIMRGENEKLAHEFQEYKDQYGYGNVFIFSMVDQAVRLMLELYPPYNAISFDDEYKAVEDFECLIIGFGECGQRVLMELIMNGQFHGSHFKCSVLSKDCDKRQGYVRSMSPGVFENYDISFLPYDAQSFDAYEYINERKNSLKYIVNTISSESENKVITHQIMKTLEKENIHIPFVQISNAGIVAHIPGEKNAIKSALLTKKSVDFKQIYLMAMVLNNKYSSNGKNGLWEDWKNCDYFSRLSSKASADFIPAYLKIMKKSQHDIERTNSLTLTPIQKENLGRTEHLRWMAFHYCMGWTKMEDEVWEQRANQYLEEKKTMDKPSTRISKDAKSFTHACLVSWEDLNILSEKENKVTGKNVDYQQYDIDNILLIPELFKIAREKKYNFK